MRHTRVAIAIGFAFSVASSGASAQIHPEDFPSFVDGALVPAKFVDPEKTGLVHVDDEMVDTYANVAAEAYCQSLSTTYTCELNDISRREVAGVKPESAYTILDVAIDVTRPGYPTETRHPDLDILLVRSCTSGAILADDSDKTQEDRGRVSGERPVRCRFDPLASTEKALGVPDEGDSNTCPMGNAPTVGNPINPTTMTKIEVTTDVASPSGSGLDFQRVYSSGAFSLDDSLPATEARYPASARLGSRWRGTYDRAFVSRRYYDPATKAYVQALHLVREDGREVRFVPKGDTFVADAEERGVLRKEGDAGWTYTWADQTVEQFDDQGRLRVRTDPNGNTITLVYDEIEVDIGFKVKVLVRVEDRQGRSLYFGYDRVGRINKVTTPDGHQIKYAYDESLGAGLDADMVAVTYADGRSLRYIYDEPGMGGTPNHKLTGIITSDGKRYATFHYDSRNRAIESNHGDGLEYTKVSLSGKGQVAVSGRDRRAEHFLVAPVLGRPRLSDRRENYLSGEVSQRFDYLDSGRVSTYTDYLGVPTTYQYDSIRHLEIERTEAAGTPVSHTVKTTWHPVFNLPSRIEDATHWISFQYDVHGNLTQRREGGVSDAGDPASVPWPDERITTYTYDPAGRVLTTDGPLRGTADTTRFSYFETDATECVTGSTCAWRKGDLHATTNALGHTNTVLIYDGAGRILAQTDANGVRTDRRYDERGRPIEVAVRGNRDGLPSASDIISLVSYDANGNFEMSKDPDGVVVRHEYDAAHRLVAEVDAAGNRHEFVLDGQGLPRKEVHRNGKGVEERLIERTFNGRGQLLSRGMYEDHDYDANGRQVGLRSGFLNIQEWHRDARGRVVETIYDRDTVNAHISMLYDGLDQPKTVFDPKALATAFLRNGLGDVLWQHSPDTGDTITTVDEAGRPTRTVAADGREVRRTFDTLGRLIRAEYIDGSSDEYVYDVASSECPAEAGFATGRLSSVAETSGSTVLCYDFAGRVVRKIQTTRGVRLEIGYTYTSAGRLAAVTLPDGRITRYARDTAGHISEVATSHVGRSSAVVASNVQWTSFGAIRGWTAGSRSLDRTYDEEGYTKTVRDAKAGGLSFELQWVADNVNDVRVGSLALGAWHDLIDRLEHATEYDYAYDPTGNRVRREKLFAPRKYTYAVDSHRLLSVNTTAREYDEVGRTTRIGANEFVYDVRGRMAQAKVNGVVEMNYAYNVFGQQTARYIANQVAISLYDEAGHWIGDYDAAGQPIRQMVWLDDYPLAALDGDAIYDIQSDHLGTPRAIVDRALDKVVWNWSIIGEAFGDTKPNEDPDRDGKKYIFDLRFPGQRYDAVTGLFHNGFRDYDPASGRYIQSDPLGLAGGMSTYAYAGSRPYRNVDSLGLKYAEQYAAWGAATGFVVAGGVSVAADFATGGANLVVTPAELQAGTLLGGGIGYGAGWLADWATGNGAFIKPPKDAHDPNGAKAPGKPPEALGYRDPKKGERWVPNPNPGAGGRSHGWESKDGSVWCPTGPDAGSRGIGHGGPHWDVQRPDGSHENVFPLK
ncbi:RHS repeat-associated core domain-containing protein [Luteibacter sp. E-22]|uniref:RHS repeat-associated core domain-containing protein n=1 Tax=Luteibacter sp. E-22 TaxID=3404050 RepID=UPI003CED40DE